MTNHSHRSPMVRALTDATSSVLAVSMHDRIDNEGRLSTMEIVLNGAINATSDNAVSVRHALDEQRQRVRDMLVFARIHDDHAAGRTTDDEWNAALIAARFDWSLE